MNLILLVLFVLIFQSTSFGQLDHSNESNSNGSSQTCKIERLRKNVAKMGAKVDALKPVSFEDSCESKNFCFTSEVLKSIEVSGFTIPAGSQVRYCEREGVKGIESKVMSVFRRDGLSCQSNILFWGLPSQLCFCQTDNEYKIEVDKGKKIALFPAKTSLYFKDGQVTHFKLQDSTVLLGKNLKAGEAFSVANGSISNSDFRAPDFPVCSTVRDPDEDHLYDILSRYNIRRVDLSQFSYGTECGDDYPREENVSYSSISGAVVATIKNKDMTIPEGSDLSFCNGHIVSFSAERGKVIGLWGHQCDSSVNSSWDVGDPKSQEKYRCKLFASEKWDGIELPKGAVIFFNKKKLLCVAADWEEGASIEVGGTLMKEGSFVVKNGKLQRDDECNQK